MASATVGTLRVILGADTAEFQTAMTRAEVKVQATAKSIERLAVGFSGQKTITEAEKVAQAIEKIGGASLLTTKELARVGPVIDEAIAKYRALGQQAPAHIQALHTKLQQLPAAATAATTSVSGLASVLGTLGPLLPIATLTGAVTAIGGLAKAAFDSAGEITDLAHKTGLSTDAIQRMRAVAEQTGASVDAFADATFKLGVNVSEGSKQARTAIKELGLSYEALFQLSPEEQFARVVKALEGIDNQQDRNRLGMALFGKQFSEIAAAVEEGYSQIAAAATVTSQAQLEALDAAGDAWVKFVDDLQKEVQRALGSLVLLTQGVRDAMALPGGGGQRGSLLIWSPEEQRQLEELQRNGKTYQEATDRLIAARTRLRDISLDPVVARTPPVDPAAAKAAEEAARRREQEAAALRQFYNWLGERELAAVDQHQQALDKKAAADRAYFNWLGERRMEADRPQEPLRSTLSLTPVALKSAVAMVRPAWTGLGADLMSALGTTIQTQLGPTILAAVTGGGNIGASIGSLLGTSLGSSLAGSVSKALSGVLGKTLGDTIGSLLPGLGALAGPLLGKLFASFSISPEIKAAREELTKFQSTLHATLTDQQKAAAGSEKWKLDVIAVRDAYLATGRSAAEAEAVVKRMWNTDNPKEMKKAIEEVNAVLAEGKRKAEELAAAQQELTTLQGELAALQDDQKISWEDMEEAAAIFQGRIDQLGPAFRQLKIDATAKKYINAIETMTRGGAEMGAVLFDAREELSAMVQDAIRNGSKLPANLKPWIEELQRAGLLLDENGDKIEDLSGLQFGEELESDASKATRAMQALIDKISALIDKIANLPDATVHVNYVPGQVPPAPTAPGPTPSPGPTPTPTPPLPPLPGPPELPAPLPLAAGSSAGAPLSVTFGDVQFVTSGDVTGADLWNSLINEARINPHLRGRLQVLVTGTHADTRY